MGDLRQDRINRVSSFSFSFLEGIDPLRHWYIKPNEKIFSSKLKITKALMPKNV